MNFGFLIPTAKKVLSTVLTAILNSEKIFGAGNGQCKLEAATKTVVAELSESKLTAVGVQSISDVVDRVVALINAVVEVLNSIGLLDNEPGLDVDYARLIPAVKAAFVALAELADALTGE